MKRIYPSAVDWWLVPLLLVGPVAPICAGVFALANSATEGGWLIAIGVGTGVLTTMLTVPCRYTLTDDALVIRCGLLRESIALFRIVGAERSSSWWSAPALSVRRVRVLLTDGTRVISPQHRDEFIADLEARIRAEQARSAARNR